jgi:hypothetical protein
MGALHAFCATTEVQEKVSPKNINNKVICCGPVIHVNKYCSVSQDQQRPFESHQTPTVTSGCLESNYSILCYLFATP